MDSFSSKMKQLWDQRFGEATFAYGTAPNHFFAQQLSRLAGPGRLLLPAEGQGRNAVYSAGLGWQVDAFDLSEVGKSCALALAASQNVTLNYWIEDLAGLSLEKNQYDVIGLVFMHLPPDLRKTVHRKLIESLKPGGRIILQGFSKKQLGLQTGGPKILDMLFSEEELREDFGELEIDVIEERVTLNEGPYHQGEAEVINLVGIKT